MSLQRLILAAALAVTSPLAAFAQSVDDTERKLSIELNALQDVEGACRLTFLARNGTDVVIDKAVFETVIFDTSGGVISLSLFDFRELPADRPRVRQFDLPGLTCSGVGQTLINGSNTCTVSGADSDICDSALVLSSRVAVELLG